MFTENDIKQIKEHGLSPELVNEQIQHFINDFPPAILKRPALVGDGIQQVSDTNRNSYIEKYESAAITRDIIKFVPASGAATRMFKNLFGFMSEYDGSEAAYDKMKEKNGAGTPFEFFKNLEKFAFYEDLKETFSKSGTALSEAHLKKEYTTILEYFLLEKGLNYGNLPKGLLKFHSYKEGPRTPVMEHIVEGTRYATGKNNTINLHFTVSPEHMDRFKAHVNDVVPAYEKEFDCNIAVTYSIQNPATDTIAVDLDNNPFRNEDETLLFRPAGHGALLENLNRLDADIVFIKNIDNVVPDGLKEETDIYKKVLAGILIEKQNKIFDYINKLQAADSANLLEDVRSFISQELGYEVSGTTTKEDLISILDRPLRVAGMVKSDGDPGGGPFWVKDESGNVSLQIVETAQIDLSDEQQKLVFNQATHFNPVDIVCSLKNHKGEKYDLMKHRDPSTGFITQKSKDGKDLKAQELPGLWNGSMAFWNNIFVEVPLITFNPVKTVNDLLKKEHQG